MYLVYFGHIGFAVAAHFSSAIDKLPVLIKGCCRGSRNMTLFNKSIEVDEIRGHLTVLDHPVRRFQKTIFIDLGKRSQVSDETYIRALGGGDRADAAIVGAVDVAHFKTSAFA